MRTKLIASGNGEKRLEFLADGGPGHIHNVLCEECLELATTGLGFCSRYSSSGTRSLK